MVTVVHQAVTLQKETGVFTGETHKNGLVVVGECAQASVLHTNGVGVHLDSLVFPARAETHRLFLFRAVG